MYLRDKFSNMQVHRETEAERLARTFTRPSGKPQSDGEYQPRKSKPKEDDK